MYDVQGCDFLRKSQLEVVISGIQQKGKCVSVRCEALRAESGYICPDFAQSKIAKDCSIRAGNVSVASGRALSSSRTIAGGVASALIDFAVAGQSMVPSPGHKCSSFTAWLS